MRLFSGRERKQIDATATQSHLVVGLFSLVVAILRRFILQYQSMYPWVDMTWNFSGDSRWMFKKSFWFSTIIFRWHFILPSKYKIVNCFPFLSEIISRFLLFKTMAIAYTVHRTCTMHNCTRTHTAEKRWFTKRLQTQTHTHSRVLCHIFWHKYVIHVHINNTTHHTFTQTHTPQTHYSGIDAHTNATLTVWSIRTQINCKKEREKTLWNRSTLLALHNEMLNGVCDEKKGENLNQSNQTIYFFQKYRMWRLVSLFLYRSVVVIVLAILGPKIINNHQSAIRHRRIQLPREMKYWNDAERVEAIRYFIEARIDGFFLAAAVVVVVAAVFLLVVVRACGISERYRTSNIDTKSMK